VCPALHCWNVAHGHNSAGLSPRVYPGIPNNATLATCLVATQIVYTHIKRVQILFLPKGFKGRRTFITTSY
jgi:hypothetical protein